MGFFKFLKREKKESLDELDLPPAPPPLEGFEESMPELPDFPEFEEKISMPKEEEFKFELPEKEEDVPELGKEEVPEFSGLPEMEEMPLPPIPPVTAPSIPEPMPSIPEEPEQAEEEEQPSPALPDAYPKARRLFSQEKKVLRERPTAKTIYVKVDRFKAALGSINVVRGDLRKSEETLMKLENVKTAKDKSFDKIRSSLDDLQKKLIFIDKTLFKGDGN